MALSGYVTVFLTVLTTALAGVAVWTPWWISFGDGVLYAGLYSICVDLSWDNCVHTFSSASVTRITMFVCGVAGLVCLFFTALFQIMSVAKSSRKKSQMKASLIFNCFGTILLLVTIGLFMLNTFVGSIITPKLSYSSFLMFAATILSAGQCSLIFQRHKVVSTEVAIV